MALYCIVFHLIVVRHISIEHNKLTIKQTKLILDFWSKLTFNKIE